MFFKTYTFPLFLDRKWNFFENSSGKIRQGYQKWNLRAQRTTFRTNFFWKVVPLIFFGPWAKNSRDFVRKISASESKLDSHFQRKLSGETVPENLQIVIFWSTERKNSAGCRKNVSGASKLLSTSPWELFEEKVFEKFLHLLWTFFQIIFGNWAGKVWPACQNCIHRFYKII